MATIKMGITEAKKNIPYLVEQAHKGVEVIITFGRWKKPVAKITAIPPPPNADLETGSSETY